MTQTIANPAPFTCHGTHEPEKWLTRGQAWVPDLGTLRKALSRGPGVADLKAHTFCGACASLGRKAGLRFYLHDATVHEMERRRQNGVLKARQAFGRYLK